MYTGKTIPEGDPAVRVGCSASCQRHSQGVGCAVRELQAVEGVEVHGRAVLPQ